MTVSSISLIGTVLPDAFVGVPYLSGIPAFYGNSATGLSIASVSAGSLPPGLSVKAASTPVVTGTVVVAGDTGSQVDGAYSFSLVLGDSNGSATGAFTMNVHYLSGEGQDQDLSVAEQADLRETPFLNTSSTDSANFTQTTEPTDAA